MTRSLFQSAKKLMDIALEQAHELGYDENQPQLKEARISLPLVNRFDCKIEINSSF